MFRAIYQYLLGIPTSSRILSVVALSIFLGCAQQIYSVLFDQRKGLIDGLWVMLSNFDHLLDMPYFEVLAFVLACGFLIMARYEDKKYLLEARSADRDKLEKEFEAKCNNNAVEVYRRFDFLSRAATEVLLIERLMEAREIAFTIDTFFKDHAVYLSDDPATHDETQWSKCASALELINAKLEAVLMSILDEAEIPSSTMESEIDDFNRMKSARDRARSLRDLVVAAEKSLSISRSSLLAEMKAFSQL